MTSMNLNPLDLAGPSRFDIGKKGAPDPALSFVSQQFHQQRMAGGGGGEVARKGYKTPCIPQEGKVLCLKLSHPAGQCFAQKRRPRLQPSRPARTTSKQQQTDRKNGIAMVEEEQHEDVQLDFFCTQLFCQNFMTKMSTT
eukprot:EG_transcript_35660